MSNEQSIQEFAEAHQEIKTPYYLIDEERLLKNMEKMQYVFDHSGAKAVLALKCFSTWSVFPLMSKYMAGTTSSSLNEARLGHEKFGKETHAYSVVWTPEEIDEVKKFATKIIFNSAAQFMLLYPRVERMNVGIRINPGFSYSHFDLADPTRKCSRLGVKEEQEIKEILPKIKGVMIHNQCENDDFEAFANIVDQISEHFGWLLEKLEWVTLGGGIYFTKEGYPLDRFCAKLKEFAERHKIQVYVEPGESSITRTGLLVTKVLDIIRNDGEVAIVDAAANAHMPDLVTYQTPAKMEEPIVPIDGFPMGENEYQIAGRTCLAGDIFGTYKFPNKLRVGSLIPIADAAGYTMVQKTWFNGVPMPSIVVKRLDGTVDVVRQFTYDEYLSSLS
jgi:carboxynorspermidine decarboxylase